MSRRRSFRIELRESGFVVEGGRDGPLQAVRGGRHAVWEIGSTDRAWLLRRSGRGDGFELFHDEGAPERGEPACYLFRTGHEGDASHVLAEDGRLFRIVLRGPHDPRYELVGWEVPGPYLVARPETGGVWKLEPTVAGDGLEGLSALTLLFAAEILDRDGSLSFGDSA